MDFIEKLNLLLKERGVSRNKLATDLKFGSGTIATWEKRKTIPNGETLQKIAEYFGISVDYLLEKTDKPNNEAFGIMCTDKNIVYSKEETDLIVMYRQLDEHGKSLLKLIAKHELERCMNNERLMPSLVAARSVNGNEPIHIDTLPDMSKVAVDDTDI